MGERLSRAEKLTADFIEESAAKHGGKYDYSRVKPCPAQIPVEVICPQHGIFKVRKDRHRRGVGCGECLRDLLKTIKTRCNLIEEFLKIQEYRYDYSLIPEGRVVGKVKIICPDHGIFEQTVQDHLTGMVCRGCFYERRRGTLEQVIEAFRERHGDKYDYSLFTEYRSSTQKIKIVCPEHGVFQQTVEAHRVSVDGCQTCASISARNNIKKSLGMTQREFIARAEEVHDFFYDYSLVEYVTSDLKVKIICPKHGVFEQRPRGHLTGRGCIECKNDKTTYNLTKKYEDNKKLGDKKGIVYLLKVKGVDEEFLKVGITSNKIRRYRAHRKYLSEAGYSFHVIAESEMTNLETTKVEREVLGLLKELGLEYHPKSKFPGSMECAKPSAEEIIIGILDSYAQSEKIP